MATAEEIITEANAAYADAKATADAASNQASAALASAESAVAGLYIPTSTGGFDPVDVGVGAVTVPTLPADLADDVKTAFDDAFARLNDDARPLIEQYLADFFPDISAALVSGSEQWLIDTINLGRYVPASVENAIWNRARDREVQDAQRAEQSLIDATAARGFDLPPGALAANIAANQTELSKKLATLERDIAIKDFDIANENTKFAVQQAASLRVSFVGALADFIRLATQQPTQAMDYARTMLTAKTSLYDAAVRLYSAQVNEQEMQTSVALKNRGLELQWAELSDRTYVASRQLQVDAARVKAGAATSAADALSRIAAAALATRNTMLSAAAGV
jgi:hypothetical protein